MAHSVPAPSPHTIAHLQRLPSIRRRSTVLPEVRAVEGVARSSKPSRWLLVALLTGQFMAILDATIVNVATPTIRTDLHTTGAALQLVVAGYTIAYAVLLISGARLGALAGFRRTFVAGLAAFTAASLACGLAPSSTALIVFRCIQGAGAALMVPQVFSIIQRSFEGGARARALSLYGAVIALGAVVGQVLGGLIVTADLFGTGWRPVFLVNVPIGIALLALAPRVLPADARTTARALDVAGLVSLASAVLLMVVPLVLGREEGWPAWTLVSFVTSVVAAAVFVGVERAVAARGGAPLISGRVVRAPGVIPGIVAVFFGMAGYGGFLFAFAQHLQAGLGDTPLRAGLTFAPAALGFAIASLNWRRLPPAWFRASIPAGFAVAAVGYAVVAGDLGGGSAGGLALPVLLFTVGVGMGLAFSPTLAVALAGVAPGDAADASGLLTTVIQLGIVVGVASFGGIYLSLATAPGPRISAGALDTTLVLVALAMALSAVAAVPLAWRRVASGNRPALAGSLD